jgi:hypothetical protein
VQRLCGTCFGPLDAYTAIDYRDSHDTCKKVLAAIPNIIRTYPQQCAWANGTPAPPTTMSGGTRSDAAHDHHA